MLANFYYEPSYLALAVGIVAALAVVFALSCTGRPTLAGLGSAFACAVIAFVVWACGRGDLVGLFYLMISVPLAAALGGAAGGLLAVAKRRVEPPKTSESQNPKDAQRAGSCDE